MDFETFGVEKLSLNEAHILCGPLLRYISSDYKQGIWRGSCLIVSNTKQAPPLTFRVVTDSSHQEQAFEPQTELIDVYRDVYCFWRYELVLPLVAETQTVSYQCAMLPQSIYQFYLPAIHENMRFMFYSCSGFSDVDQKIKDRFGEKEAPLWADMLDRHSVAPFHVMLGGGDQLYQDRLTHEEFMKPWLDEKMPEKRMAMKLPPEMVNGLEHFYFWNYIKNFGCRDNPVQATAYASIPSVNMWDDHDIIDGYGSYPQEMQEADCFKVLFKYASRFYYSFQQHTTIQLAERDGMIRGQKPDCNHIVTTLGPQLGLVCLDARGERTKGRVCSKQSYDAVFNAVNTQLPSIIHLLVLTGVPIIYPRLTLFEKAMDSASNLSLATLAGKTGALGNVISGQLNKWNGDPELLDDMNDHWTSGLHEQERRIFIESLQSYARQKSVRVSFLGGDVHCCGAGKLYSKDMKEREEGDPFLMVQIISSAIVNVPPPQALLTILNQNSSYITFDGNIEEKMFNLFKFSPNGNTRKNKKLMGTRNYCAGYIDGNTGKINFWIQCEQAAGVKGTKGYLVDVPKLVFGAEGCRLHDHGHAHHNQHTKSPIPPGAGITTPIQSWKGFSQTFDYHPAT